MTGICYRDGLGVEQDLEEAARYFALAADQGHAEAKACLAALDTGKDRDYQQAMLLYFGEKYEEAKEAFEALGDYEHSKEFLAMCEKALQESDNTETETLKAGDTIQFGAYEQDNDPANGKEPIDWLVLDVQNGRALLLSIKGLDCQKYYDNVRKSATWEESSLRNWLNNSFLKSAFDATEQSRIPITTVSADMNPTYRSDPGPDTRDKVFLLSITEVNQYLPVNENLKCFGTAYCFAQGAMKNNTGTCSWWLRTPGMVYTAETYNAACVNASGSINDQGNETDSSYIAVRPALWMDLEEHPGTPSEEKEIIGYNMVHYGTQMAASPNYRMFRNYSINGEYSEYRARESYGEKYFTRYADADMLARAKTYEPGEAVTENYSGYQMGTETAYYFGDDQYVWFIDSPVYG